MHLPKAIHTFGIWTQYTGFCFYEPYDILLQNGTIFKSMTPNEKEWRCIDTDIASWETFVTYCERFDTTGVLRENVVAVRLLTDRDIEERHIRWATGKLRLDRIKQTYGDGIEFTILRRNYLLKDHQIRETINELRSVAVKYGATQQLRTHIEKCFKETFKHLFYNPK